MLDLKKFKLKDADLDTGQGVQIERVSNKDIAVIGMACKFAQADQPEEFWVHLRQGLDLVGPLPGNRKADTDAYLAGLGVDISQVEYNEVAYLREIDTFDPTFFKISPKEASLMDPNQRLFLMTAWKAIEDAGYGGKKLAGTETGIYLGFSSDFGYEYKRFIAELEPGSNAISTAGNIKSIIASRIAYIMDLKGPSLVVDTACSSTLTAIHLACTALRNGECDAALAGSVKIHFVNMKGADDGIGIRSSIGRARTFDESSDGTGSGEGCGVLMLKPLKKALEDGDAVYAVIKGSALNQDGSSIGITAPNSLAQAAVIEKAWKDAGIDPETITYIEAHGTGTKLGDPIEIDGVTRAFRKYTRKNQFCGIGSVKTNLGHLDHAAGIAGMIKSILALQHGELPASLHFQHPNPKIDFAASPVYVVDSLRKWQTTPGTPRRCGVSAFGLSGTNAHMVLEEAPDKAKGFGEERKGPHILTVSAMSQNVLERLLDEYQRFFAAQSQLNMTGLCYTANTGRGHYNYRAAFIVNDLADCREKLQRFTPEGSNPAGTYYSEVKVKKEDERRAVTHLAHTKLRELISLPEPDGRLLEDLAQLYVQGADVEWDELYREIKVQKLNLPTYPFEQKRCWLSYENVPNRALAEVAATRVLHPLLEEIIEESAERVVYRTHFNPAKHWVLSEHKVSDNCVVPGVTYLEMSREAGRKFYPDGALRLKDVMFISPLIANPGETKEVQTVVVHRGEYLEFSVVSEDGLIKHAEGKIYPAMGEARSYDLAELKARQSDHHTFNYENMQAPTGAIATGPRWRNLREVFVSENEVLAYLEIDGIYTEDLEDFILHPALMDRAVNVASQHVGQGLYLPFSYRDLTIYGPTPKAFYSYIRKKPLSGSLETVSFDLTLLDPSGVVFAEVEHYTVKKVHAVGEKFKDLASRGSMYYQTRWIDSALSEAGNVPRDGEILLFKDKVGYAEQLAVTLREIGRTIIEVESGNEYRKSNDYHFTIGTQEADYTTLVNELKERNLAEILHLWTIGETAATEFADLVEQEERSLMSLFYLTKALIHEKIAKDLPLVLITDQAHEVVAEDGAPNPIHAAYLGLGKVIGQEYSTLQVQCIDLDRATDPATILREIDLAAGPQRVAYRQGQRFVEEFSKVEMETLPGKEMTFHETGVYLITGGTGGLGLEMAKYLTEQARVTIALLNRSPLPARDQWNSILEANADERLCRKLRQIQQMEVTGATIEVISANVANPTEMANVVADLKARYGRIHGVIHGAGVAGDGFLLRKDDASFHAVLDPKIRGTWILDHVTREDAPDFVVLMSSINAITGGQGQSDYTAANTYLDAYATMGKAQGQRVIAINWPAWTEIGMAADHGVAGGIFGSVTPSRGMELFAEILRKEIHRVIIGEINYNLIAQNEVALPFALSAELAATVKNRQNRLKTAAPKAQQTQKMQEVVIKGREQAEYNETEMTVARIWGEVLGLDAVDIYENFYDLGGDSILATHLLKKMEQSFPGLVDISDIFTYSTVSAMAEYIEGKMEKKAVALKKSPAVSVPEPVETVINLDDLDSILDQLESGDMTVTDAEKMTVRRGNA